MIDLFIVLIVTTGVVVVVALALFVRWLWRTWLKRVMEASD